MSNVVSFPKAEENTFADAWAIITPTMRQRSESKERVKKLWNQEAKRLGGQSELLDRLRTYMRTNEDLKRWGGPGLQVILRQGRLDNYEATHSVSAAPVNAFPREDVRNTLLKQCGADWVVSYLDPCGIEGTSVLARTDYAVRKLLEHRHVFKMAGFTGIKKRV